MEMKNHDVEKASLPSFIENNTLVSNCCSGMPVFLFFFLKRFGIRIGLVLNEKVQLPAVLLYIQEFKMTL